MLHEAHHAVLLAAAIDADQAGVIDVHVVVRIEVGVYGDTEQTALGITVHVESDDGVGLQRAVLEEAHSARHFFGVKEPPLGIENHSGGPVHACEQGLDAGFGRQGLGAI